MEVYKNKPIFYDPGDFMFMVNTITRMPADFYFWPPLDPQTRDWKATVADAYDAKEDVPKPLNPPGGVSYTRSTLRGKVLGSVVALCSFSEDRKLTEVKLYPLTLIREPRSQFGLPLAADAETAGILINYFAELSSAFGTKVEFKDGIGIVRNSD
jgi:poly-gamma-glutamate synthesis protein (capsule biosynthesis protein)